MKLFLEKKVKKETGNYSSFYFNPKPKLIPSGKNKEGVFKVRYMSTEDYISTSGKWLVENGFYENEIHREVQTFGNITQVFSTYESFKSKKDTQHL